MLIGYARVSTTGQNLESQIEHLQAVGCDKIYQEKLTGFDRRRPQLEKMLASLQSGDTLVVTSLDRLARSTHDLFVITQKTEASGPRSGHSESPGQTQQALWGSSYLLFLQGFLNWSAI